MCFSEKKIMSSKLIQPLTVTRYSSLVSLSFFLFPDTEICLALQQAIGENWSYFLLQRPEPCHC